MARPARPLPEGSIENLRAAMRKACTKGQYKQVLAVWLRALLNLSSAQVAAALELRPDYVRKIQSRYFRKGEAAFREPPRGRGPRPGNMPRALVQALLEDLAYFRRQHGLRLTRRTVKAECEAAVGHPISESTTYLILRRQGWRASELHRELPRKLWPPAAPDGARNPRLQ